MDERSTLSRALRFGAFEVDLSGRELRKQGRKIRLQDQPFQVLAALLEKAGEVVSRDELREKLWSGDTYVDFDHSLNNCINKLREALGDSAASPRFIETQARRGYRFIAPVEIIPPPAATTEPPSSKTTAGPAQTNRPSGYGIRALPALGLLIALGTALSVWSLAGWRQGLPWHEAEEPIQSLAVLPLENFSGDPAQAYLADSMTDQLITKLAGIRAIRVTSRTSVMRFKGARKPLRDIARDLDVDAIVEGSVLRSGQDVRITVQLVHAASNRRLGAHTYHGDLGNVSALQHKAAVAIARQIQVKLSPQEQAGFTNSRTVDSDAQEAYFQGRYYWNTKRTKEGLEKAIRFFQKAIATDPDYAQAYSGLADSFVLLGSRSFLPPQEAFAKAKTEAIKALALDNTLAEAHAAPAFASVYYDWDWAVAEREFRRAIDLNPSYSNAHHWYSHFLIAMGRFEESLLESKRSVELDPLDPGMVVHLGEHYYYARQYEHAIQQLRKAIEMDAARYRAHDDLGRVYQQKGMHPQAWASFENAIAASHGSSASQASLAAGYAAGGRPNEALKIVARLKLDSRRQYVPAYGLAEIYAVLGDRNEAFAWLERAYLERSSSMAYIKVEPRLDGLRSDRRFQDLLQRMHLM